MNIMKWMNGWSCEDLDNCDADLIPVIIEMIREEQKELANR